MNRTVFFRLLDVDIDARDEALQMQIAAFNDRPLASNTLMSGMAEKTFTVDPLKFARLPRSPFAYWAPESAFRVYGDFDPLQDDGRTAVVGLQTSHNFRFLRAWWEVNPGEIGRELADTYKGHQWIPFSKGGPYSPFHLDLNLVVNWLDGGEPIKGFQRSYVRNEEFYFRHGLTWPRRPTSGLSFRIIPDGCSFSVNSPCFFAEDYWPWLAITNSLCFEWLMSFFLGRGVSGRQTLTYEAGMVQQTPVPGFQHCRHKLADLARRAYDLQRERDRGDETTHSFCVPWLVLARPAQTLHRTQEMLVAEDRSTDERLGEVQAQVDELVFGLYEVDADDRALIREEMSNAPTTEHDEDLGARVQNLLMWCVGVAFGRWDVRKALDPSRLPPLGDPFDPLPRCAPGALVGDDGLPLPKKDLPEDYPLPIAWDGILVDDPDHPSDIVGGVQGVLDLLWADRAGAIEREICDIIGVDRLRDYFRDYRNGFFAFHAKRYSKSRRKAPIYWLLQSEERHYAVWFYYHRLDTSMLYAAGRDYADPKVELEQGRTLSYVTLQQGADTLEGSARRLRYREIERQQGVVRDVRAFRNKLDQIALLDLAFDLNDGVLLNIAPLHELVPWTYAGRTWTRLQEGRHGWSSMAGQLREAGLIQSPRKD